MFKGITLAALCAVSIITSCKNNDNNEPQSSNVNVIIGANDFIKVLRNGQNIPAKYASIIDAFGMIRANGSICTATHIGNGIVLTAGHCFEGASATRQNNVPCSNATVDWGYREDKRPYMTSICTTLLARQWGNGLDYTIFKVSPIPSAKVDVDLSGYPVSGTRMTIFSDPLGRPLEWSQVCYLNMTTSSYNTKQENYSCDTEAGSSGSTVLNDDTLKVIGIHWGGSAQASANYAGSIMDIPLREILGR